MCKVREHMKHQQEKDNMIHMKETRLKEMEKTLSRKDSTIEHQAAEIRRLEKESHSMRKEIDLLKTQNNDLQFYLDAKTGGSDILSAAFRLKQNTPRLTNILDYQAYVDRLTRNLLVYGCRESVDKIDKHVCLFLAKPDEEHLLRLVIQETVDSSILGSTSAQQDDTISPSLSIIFQLHTNSLKERKDLILNLERVMQALRVDSDCSKFQMLAQYKDIEKKLRKYSIPGETIGYNSTMYYAFKSLEHSSRYRDWAEPYDYNFQSIDTMLSPFVDLDDLFKKAKWQWKPRDLVFITSLLLLLVILMYILCFMT
ncbi:unnamed protein product [Ambrosiozyma monospora]|uniref:Unnamed protein product n=1 Tax=Ambrosiozyma monospora TaxID=43982 RepID=A0ACB5TAT2_AMBMO|nr:unnamed protein product [Ambrosiozyma monospora]